ncbi:hypothetical protein EV361DRAFT_951278 [Lentinula raphanica]|nr:hypothetical protein C8R42DRAFT_688887 [Lentinula raphanica]KAJ3827039.1 hypothetical protein F5880DRAFT_1540376 [Lentinula raphanica]KAJ3969645.1 hypothetical protein EV361DRAFT_951278 [Lentinula raphanica]
MSGNRYQTVKNGWGSRPNFQHSHGLNMTPEHISEGNAILDGYMRHDNHSSNANTSHSQNAGKAQGGSSGGSAKSGTNAKSGGRT